MEISSKWHFRFGGWYFHDNLTMFGWLRHHRWLFQEHFESFAYWENGHSNWIQLSGENKKVMFPRVPWSWYRLFKTLFFLIVYSLPLSSLQYIPQNMLIEMLCLLFVWLYYEVFVDSCDLFNDILQVCLTGIVNIVRAPVKYPEG